MPDTPHERMPTLERFDRYGDDARTPAPAGVSRCRPGGC